MNKLPENFELDRYGLHCRLVREDDAEFIVKLRTDPEKMRFVTTISPSIDDQIRWIREYKQRESEGTDYYFIYSYRGKLAGVNRIYDIESNHFIHGSWLFINEIPPYCALAAAVVAREIAYNELGLDEEVDTIGIHVDNTMVLQFAEFMGCEFTGSHFLEKGEYRTSHLTKEMFDANKPKILKLFPKKVLKI